MGSCAAPSAKRDDKFITTDYLQQCQYFHLDERDLDFVNQRRGRHNRFGIALQLTTARFLGTFLNDLMQIPFSVRHYVAAQLVIPRPEVLSRYAQRENTRWEHHALIRQHYGYHDFGDFPWAFRLKRLLYTRAWLSNERPGLMFDFATAWLLQNKVLLPAASTLTRIIGEVRDKALAAVGAYLRVSGPKGRLRACTKELPAAPPTAMKKSSYNTHH